MLNEFWVGEDILGWSEWQFQNSLYTPVTEDGEEVDTEPVKDVYTDVAIIDNSANNIALTRDYQLTFNNTLSLTDQVYVFDSWTFEQSVKETEGDFLTWFTTKVTFTGSYWEQVFQWDGTLDTEITHSLSSGLEPTMHLTWYPEVAPGYEFKQEVNLDLGTWKVTVGNYQEDSQWNQWVDLVKGKWTQAYVKEGVLIW